MAALPLRTRDQPDIRARISIHDDDSPNDIKELLIADQTQNKLRSQQSWHPLDTPNSLHRTILRKTRTLPYPYRLGHLQDLPISDPLPNPLSLNRSASFDSLSTLHRHAEAASLSRYRDSPISAIGRPSAALACEPDIVYEPQDPCPPLRVETLSQQRKYQKLLKKSLKKKEKEQIKAQKEDEQLRRAFLAAEVAAERRKNAIARGEVIPARSKSTKTIASEVLKKLSLSRPLSLKRSLSKLGRSVKKDTSNPPTLDDFSTKQGLHEYLNPPRRSDDIAELPAELPQYTPFQNSTRTQDNEPLNMAEDAPKPDAKIPDEAPKEESPVTTSPKTSPRMRCDSCQGPIRLSQVYYQCSICENGDRIVCSSCDQAGWSCRHDLIERVRSVSRARDISTTPSTTRPNREGSRHTGQDHTAAMWGLNVPDCIIEEARFTESPQATISAANPWAYNDVLGIQGSKHAGPSRISVTCKQREGVKEIDFRRREQEMVLREKDINMREREASFREQRASLRERESALEIKQHVFALQLQTALVRQMQEAATGVGSQFPDLTNTDHVRSHATKRKAAGGQASISPSNSTGSNQKSSPNRSPSGGPNEDDEDEAGAGTPKKVKQDPDALSSPEKLYACPYCKFDKSRYSELNMQEKQYRGCSSGYWPDISRLKQHLYRVHCRRLHCLRCWNKFESKAQLEHHMREVNGCSLAECPCPEKFDEAQYNDIRRKRPASSPEQVWYTIFNILFPGQPQPASPYADNVKAQSSSISSPSVHPPQDAMDVLSEAFESRLNQHGDAPEQAWLRLPGAREFIREQLRASMSDVLLRLGNANSPSIGGLDISPSSALAPGSTRRNSISLTPNSSIPPSPVTGPGSMNQAGADQQYQQYLYPAHPVIFSRPLPSRSAPAESKPRSAKPSAQQHFSSSGMAFPTPIDTDVENDRYDDECHSWSHGDEHVISPGFTFDFNAGLGVATIGDEQLISSDGVTNADNIPNIQQFNTSNYAQPQALAPVTQLKPKHSTSSSVDSGYGSFSHRSSTASSRPVSASHSTSSNNVKSGIGRLGRDKSREKIKGKALPNPAPLPPSTPRLEVRVPSPVNESAINFDALDVPYSEFLGKDGEMDLDEFGNVNGESLSAFLDRKYLHGPSDSEEMFRNENWGDDIGGGMAFGI
ncbi:hypothetical protein LTR84_012529 [Exophiala bonariae]|uniref:C2H2-type domain-containing protein n=1 Tax=Exophiala bonariae TaxID=1690606 RepID=A0AAV9NEL1_9EURO|nr:hypothetical protein LTR84_012529 [Exophiala bonariae]